MTIILEIGKEKIKLSFSEGKTCIIGIKWKENHDLSRILLVKIDELLKKYKVGVDKISGYKIISEVPKSWTTYRIAEITLKALMVAKE